MVQRKYQNGKNPLDSEALRELALFYVGRYATTKTKLIRYLERKIYERGWGEPDAPDIKAPNINALAEKMAELGFIDEDLYARSKTASLLRRGYGRQHIARALHQDGLRIDLADIVARIEAISGPLTGPSREYKAGSTLGAQPGEQSEQDEATQYYQAAIRLAKRKKLGPWSRRERDHKEIARQIAMLLRAGHDYQLARKITECNHPAELES